MAFEIKPLTKDLWPSLEKLFGKHGASNGCWCMFWRIGAEYHKRDRVLNKVDLRKLAETNAPIGLLAIDEATPVGWCQVTPRDNLPWLLKSGYGNFNTGNNIWCISCFYIKPGYRKLGVSRALIRAAVVFAGKAGADFLEAYPRDSPSSFTGYPSTFSHAGFSLGATAKYGRLIATYAY